MKPRRRVLIEIIAVILLAALVFALAVLSLEAHHDCAGEDCRVCAVLAVCRDVLSFCALAASARFTFSRVLTGKAADAFARALTALSTPVKLKVKLSN